MRHIWAALFVMLAFSFAGCGSYQPSITVEPATELSRVVEECLADFKKEFPRKGRLVKDGYYAYGKLYTVFVDYTAAAPKDALYGAIKWTKQVQGSRVLHLAVNTDGFVAIGGKYNGVVTRAQDAPQAMLKFLEENRWNEQAWPYTDIKYTIVGSYIFKNFDGNSDNISWSGLLDKQYAEKYISPEERAAQREAELAREREAREKEKEALQRSRTLRWMSVEMFVTQSPFYHQRAEKLFLEWQEATITEDEKALKAFEQRFKKLNQNEQYEFKNKAAQYRRFVMSF